jgi:DNA mismatch endonuclease, patch repair protein
MSAVRDRDSKVELRLRRALFAAGLRYRLRPKTVRGRPDLAFIRQRVAVFIDGDFWHGNSWRLRGDSSLEDHLARYNNSDFWIKKIRGNISRDTMVTQTLRDEGWLVLRYWESALLADMLSCVSEVVAKVRARV